MTTKEMVKDINEYFGKHPEQVLKRSGLLSSPRVIVNGYTFDEYDNGKMWSMKYPWVNYHRIIAPNGQILRCNDYSTWIRRLHRFMTKHGCFEKVAVV